MGELSRILSRKIRDELTADTGHFKEKSEELFGITSIILTHILIKRKLKNADETILPRKAFSLFLTFTHIILDNYDPSVNISEEVDRDLFEKQQKIIKVSKNTQLKFLLEMLGLSYISPGIPNIIDGFGDSDKVLKLKKTMINFLELLRERRRERVRTRSR